MSTRIEWTDETWNPTRGCTKVSAGCQHCYAMRQAHRQSGPGGGYEGLTKLTSHGPEWTGAIRLVPEALDLPLRWRKPRRVFVDSMSDLFHAAVPDEFIDRVFAVMASAHWHTFQVLTKRPERMARHLAWLSHYPKGDRNQRPVRTLANVWLGVSVENQAAADERLPWLLQTPAAVRFLSCEPLLSAIDLSRWLTFRSDGAVLCRECCWGDRCEVPRHRHRTDCSVCGDSGAIPRISWLIAGGESGPGARPMLPDWVRSLRDQCQAARVPFFFKQWGSHRPLEGAQIALVGRTNVIGLTTEGRQLGAGEPINDPANPVTLMLRVAKHFAGRELDGRTWDEYPAVPT